MALKKGNIIINPDINEYSFDLNEFDLTQKKIGMAMGYRKKEVTKPVADIIRRVRTEILDIQDVKGGYKVISADHVSLTLWDLTVSLYDSIVAKE